MNHFTGARAFTFIFPILVFGLFACSGNELAADEIIDRSRAAMEQLETYQWRSTHNTVAEGRFGARPTITQSIVLGSYSAEGRSRTIYYSSPEDEAKGTNRRDEIRIGDMYGLLFGDGSVYVGPDSGGVDVGPGMYLDLDGWDLSDRTSITAPGTHALTRVESELGIDGPSVPGETLISRTREWVIYIDKISFRLTRSSISTDSLFLQPQGPGSLQRPERRTSNEQLFAFDEPVDIPRLDGFGSSVEPGI